MSQQTVSIDQLRTLAYTSISGSYTAVGGVFSNAVRLICFTNTTDADMYFSNDGVNNYLIVPAGAFKLFDLTTNKFTNQQYWVMEAGTQWYVKQNSMPSKGSVYIECLWGQ